MERGLRNRIVAPLLVIGMGASAMGGAAVLLPNPRSTVGVEAPACLPPDVGTAAPDDVDVSTTLHQAGDAIDQTQFFVSAGEYEGALNAGQAIYNRTTARNLSIFHVPVAKLTPFENNLINEADNVDWNQLLSREAIAAKKVLDEQGISVSVIQSANEDGYLNDSNQIGLDSSASPSVLLLETLAYLPKAIVDASSLKHVVLGAQYGTDEDYAVPVVKGDTLYVTSFDQVSAGLAEMVLNACPDRQAILDQMKPTNIYGDRGNPQSEFIGSLSNAIEGWNWYGGNDLKHNYGHNDQLAQAVFNRFVPTGQDYEIWGDYIGYYGNAEGYPPTELTGIVEHLAQQIAAMDAKSQKKIDYLKRQATTLVRLQQKEEKALNREIKGMEKQEQSSDNHLIGVYDGIY